MVPQQRSSFAKSNSQIWDSVEGLSKASWARPSSVYTVFPSQNTNQLIDKCSRGPRAFRESIISEARWIAMLKGKFSETTSFHISNMGKISQARKLSTTGINTARYGYERCANLCLQRNNQAVSQDLDWMVTKLTNLAILSAFNSNQCSINPLHLEHTHGWFTSLQSWGRSKRWLLEQVLNLESYLQTWCHSCSELANLWCSKWVRGPSTWSISVSISVSGVCRYMQPSDPNFYPASIWGLQPFGKYKI